MNTATFLHALHRLGVRRFVICPGSRSAPLLLALETLSQIETRVLADERSAAFHGLGWAEATNSPVGLICTSGSAGLNFSPAVAEAFYRHIPLIILSADRPAHTVGQEEGQSLPQSGMYGSLVHGNWSLNGRDSVHTVEKVLAEIAQVLKKGPLHVNYAFEEPLYLKPDEPVPLEVSPISEYHDGVQIPKAIQQAEKIVLLVGQLAPGTLSAQLKSRLDAAGIPVIGDVAANIPGNSGRVSPFANLLPKEYLPEVLICFGGTHIWRKWPDFAAGMPDGSIYEVQSHQRPIHRFSPRKSIQINSGITEFLSALLESRQHKASDFYSKWKKVITAPVHHDFLAAEESDVYAVNQLLSGLNSAIILHLGNSLSIRYLDLIRPINFSNPVYANRGVSGIDGSLSTAVGFALARPKEQHLAILGDQSLAYDSNALWVERIPENLKVVVLNNGGGQIFGMVKGPSEIPHFKSWFLNESTLNFQWLAQRYRMAYFHQSQLNEFLNSGGPALLEFCTDGTKSRVELGSLLQHMKNSIQNLFR